MFTCIMGTKGPPAALEKKGCREGKRGEKYEYHDHSEKAVGIQRQCIRRAGVCGNAFPVVHFAKRTEQIRCHASGCGRKAACKVPKGGQSDRRGLGGP